MANNLPFRGISLVADLCIFVFFLCCSPCFSISNDSYNRFMYSSVSYPQIFLQPYEWRYIRVDLPWWFSTLSLSILSDINHGDQMITKFPHSRQPLLCLRTGGPPLPYLTNASSNSSGLAALANGKFGGLDAYENHEQCYLMDKNMTVKFTNDQISPGVWYFGLFNGIGPSRTQSKMISRGQKYSFHANISVEACAVPSMWGVYCNQTVERLPCSPYHGNNLSYIGLDAQWLNQSMQTVIICGDPLLNVCHGFGYSNVYSLEMDGSIQELSIASEVKIPSTNKTHELRNIKLMCFVRYGAMSSTDFYDYSKDIRESPLIIPSPKGGIWFIAIFLVGGTGTSANVDDIVSSGEVVCYTLNWRILLCPPGRAGLNCTYESYMLQNFPSKDAASIFESYYLPLHAKMESLSSGFFLDPLLSKLSSVGEMDESWTYFFLDIPRGASGGNLHICLSSNTTSNYEIYARFGGMASVQEWDYFYRNTTSHSRNSGLFETYNSNSKVIDFYIYYAFEGTWNFVIKSINYTGGILKDQPVLSISFEKCPKKCSFHGTCQSALDTSGLTLYSYCSCDRDHGGFDCSIEIVSHRGRLLQSVFLVASNMAALLPAFWALRKKEFSEWVVFTSSGISSGLYHACDVGAWCAVSFHALQFMDFWLSFMAVVSTFVYLASIGDASRRTIHTCSSILTALMAFTDATRSANVVLIMLIGAIALLVGWTIEFISMRPLRAILIDVHFNFRWWKNIGDWFKKAAKTALKRYNCSFITMGVVMFVLAGISWGEETSESYWIWHSLWHVCIYTSSFLFLYSKRDMANPSEETTSLGTQYELTRQDSLG